MVEPDHRSIGRHLDVAPSPRRVTRSVIALAFAACALAVPIGPTKAQFFDPFFQFFAPQPQYAPPAVSRQAPPRSYRRGYVRVWVPDRPRARHARRLERVRHISAPRPASKRIRLASLPDAEPVLTRRARPSSLEREPTVKEKVRHRAKAKLPAREPVGDPVAALLNDKTLRRGDIVVLPGGPKVFKGGSSGPHRLSDFEDVSKTKLVGAKTRRQVTAMPVQATPPVARTEAAERALAKEGGDRDDKVATTGSLPAKVGSPTE